MQTHFKSPSSIQIGETVQKVRKAQSLTQADLALAADVSTPFLSALENGKRTVRLDVLMRVLDALNIGLDLRIPESFQDL